MTEGSFRALAADLRLIARANVRTTADGHKLGGELNQEVEAWRELVLEGLWAIQDQRPLAEQQQAAFAYGREIIERNRALLTQLRREILPAA